MRNIPLLSAFLILIIIISCSDNEILNEVPNKPIVNKTGSLSGSVSMNDVKFLASSIPEELFAQSSRTRNTENSESSTSIPEKEIEIIIPIIEENDTLLWIVNYKNDNGYVVISADKNRFPILGFNNDGSFSADRELNYQLEDMINNAKASKLISSTDSTNIYSEFWAEISNLEEDEEIDIEIVDEHIEQNPHTRSIPERENPLGRQSVYPLCYNVNWGTGFGYHYYMPESLLYFNAPCKLPVNNLVVSICHLMSSYWVPSKYGWMYMPNSIEQIPENDKPNLIASMFKDVSDQLGIRAEGDRGMYAFATIVNGQIQSFFGANGYSNTGEKFDYNFDEESFLKVYNSLLNWNPVLFVQLKQPNGKKRNWVIDNKQDRIDHTFVVDGYQEVKVKVTKKKYFLGIVVSTKVYYYYSDFFRFLYPDSRGRYSIYGGVTIGANSTGWFQQDHNQFNFNFVPDYNRRIAFTGIHP